MIPSNARAWKRGIGILIFWTLLGLSCAAQFYFLCLAQEKPVAWARAWRAALADWYILAALFFVTVYLCRRFPLERLFRLHNWAIHFGCSGLFSLSHLAAYILVRGVVFPEDHFAFVESFKFWFVRRFHGNLFYYWTFVIAAHALDSYRRLRERELKAAELEARLAQSQLESLKAQLQPHFLFNTLNTISELVHESPDAADQMLTQLSDLLRLSLKTVDEQEVSLEEELAFVEPYLNIQQVRMGGRLNVCWRIDPGAQRDPGPGGGFHGRGPSGRRNSAHPPPAREFHVTKRSPEARVTDVPFTFTVPAPGTTSALIHCGTGFH